MRPLYTDIYYLYDQFFASRQLRLDFADLVEDGLDALVDEPVVRLNLVFYEIIFYQLGEELFFNSASPFYYDAVIRRFSRSRTGTRYLDDITDFNIHLFQRGVSSLYLRQVFL